MVIADMSTDSVPGGTFGVRILGVSEVSRAIKDAIREDPRLADLWVEGESAGSRSPRPATRTSRSRMSVASSSASGSRRPGALGVRGPGRPSRRRPRSHRPLRATGRPPALRRVAPARRGGGPGAAVRGAQGEARGRRAVRTGTEAATARTTHDDRRHHESDRGGLEGRRDRPRATVADRRVRPRRCQGPGRGRAREHRPAFRRLEQCRDGLRRAGRAAEAPRSRSSPVAAGRSRTSGRSTTNGWSGRSWHTRSRWSAGSATRST